MHIANGVELHEDHHQVYGAVSLAPVMVSIPFRLNPQKDILLFDTHGMA